MTQQNAALVEESAAAAESLKDQAQRMTTVVANYRMDGHPRSSHSFAARRSERPGTGAAKVIAKAAAYKPSPKARLEKADGDPRQAGHGRPSPGAATGSGARRRCAGCGRPPLQGQRRGASDDWESF